MENSSRPDRTTSRIEWERSWQEDLDHFYRPTISESFHPASLPPSAMEAHSGDAVLAQRLSEIRSLCDLQGDLATYARTRCGSDGFERNWLDLSDGRRAEILLEGICRASSIAHLESYRNWCPDMTVQWLGGSGGKQFLEILQQLMPSDPHVSVTDPIVVANPAFDRRFLATLLAFPDHPWLQAFYRHVQRYARMYFLSTVMWQTLLAFYGETEGYRVGKAVHLSSKQVAAVLGSIRSKEEIARLSKDHAVERRTQFDVCWYCREPPATGAVLMACSKCRAIGRNTPYCSRECQRADWRSGKPSPHKTICGRKLTEDDLTTGVINKEDGAAEQPVRIPRAAPPFVRTPALVHQITLLCEPPFVDYVFMLPTPAADQGFTFPDLEVRLCFLSLRNRALRTGAVDAVQFLFDTLVHRAKVTPTMLKAQLEREYGVVLVANAPELPPPTGEEIEEASQTIQRIRKYMHQSS